MCVIANRRCHSTCNGVHDRAISGLIQCILYYTCISILVSKGHSPFHLITGDRSPFDRYHDEILVSAICTRAMIIILLHVHRMTDGAILDHSVLVVAGREVHMPRAREVPGYRHVVATRGGRCRQINRAAVHDLVLFGKSICHGGTHDAVSRITGHPIIGLRCK